MNDNALIEMAPQLTVKIGGQKYLAGVCSANIYE
jgi:hypothetical protein